MGECKTCFGNGFIVIGVKSDPCPECWGTGRDEGEDGDQDGEEWSDDESQDDEMGEE